MNFKRLFWGFVLVLIGVLFILRNTGVIWFSWNNIFDLWPVVLILWGISMIPMKDHFKIIFSLIALGYGAVLLFDGGGVNTDSKFSVKKSYNVTVTDDEEATAEDIDQELKLTMDSATNVVELNLDAAVGKFRMHSPTTTNLVEFNKTGGADAYTVSAEFEDGNQVVNIKRKENRVTINNRSNNYIEMYLNPAPLWDMDLAIGAADLNFDMTPYRVSSLKIEGGAAAVDVKLGALHPLTQVEVDAGAASIVFRIPESSGAEIKVETALASRSFNGFEKIGTGLYRTPNYNSAANKIHFDFDAAVSSIEILKY